MITSPNIRGGRNTNKMSSGSIWIQDWIESMNALDILVREAAAIMKPRMKRTTV